MLRQQLNQASHAYYVLAAPILSDQEYDRLYQELLELEKRHPHVVRTDSPTQRVGEPVPAGLPSVTHQIPLLSLDNIFSANQLPSWERRLRRHIDCPPDQTLDYSCELKVDGVALALRYEHGLLVQGATRGDGYRGEEITASVRTIRSIPLRLRCMEPPAWTEIRGEAFLAETTFSAINQQRRQQGDPPFANARNACAGTLRQLDPQVVASRKVDFVAYGLHISPEQTQPQQQLAALGWLSTAGFKTDSHAQHYSTMAEVEKYYQYWNIQRHQLPYGTDGVVVKVNNLALQLQVGHTQRAPRWAVAMKFSQIETKTTLRNLVTQVGRTGVVTPVAEFDPVELEGSTVARATLHNVGRIVELTGTELLHIGDTMVVRKAGGIIPEIVRVEPCSPPGEPLVFPHHCPKCGSPLVRESKEAALQRWLSDSANQSLLTRCPNLKTSLLESLAGLELEAATRCVNNSCPAILRGALRHWASRDALDIDGLGSERIEQLAECGLVHTIDDLYNLQEAEMAALEGWAVPSARALLQSLESSKQQPWHRVLYGLGIPQVGTANAKVLAQAFPSVERLMEAFAATRQFQGTDEPLLAGFKKGLIGKGRACKLQQWLSIPDNQKRLAEMENSPQQRLSLVLHRLGIPGVGLKTAKMLAQAFPSAERLMEMCGATGEFPGADEPPLDNLKGVIGKASACDLQQWLSIPDNQKRLAEMESSPQQWWPLALKSCIPDVGEETANELANTFPSAEQLVEAFAATRQFYGSDESVLDDFKDVSHPLGPEIAMSLQQWLANPANQTLLKCLAQAGLQLQCQEELSERSGQKKPLLGKTFVLTGTLASLSRSAAQQQIEAAGGTIVSSVSRKTTHLVVGDNPGSKLDKARGLGVEILDEAGLLQCLASAPKLASQSQETDIPLLKWASQENNS